MCGKVSFRIRRVAAQHSGKVEMKRIAGERSEWALRADVLGPDADICWQPPPEHVGILVRVLDGRKQAVRSPWGKPPTVPLLGLPWNGNNDDLYTFFVHAKNDHDCAIYPVRLRDRARRIDRLARSRGTSPKPTYGSPGGADPRRPHRGRVGPVCAALRHYGDHAE
jgi:hypothetical protein